MTGGVGHLWDMLTKLKNNEILRESRRKLRKTVSWKPQTRLDGLGVLTDKEKKQLREATGDRAIRRLVAELCFVLVLLLIALIVAFLVAPVL
jgi:hypothetical protein